MKKSFLLLLATTAILIISGCGEKKKNVIKTDTTTVLTQDSDSTIYGTLVDGAMNSMLLATDDGDTLELLRNQDDTTEVIFGGSVIGDRYAVIAYENYGDRFIRSAVNLESLKSHWKSLDKDFELLDGGSVRQFNTSEGNGWKSWRILNGHLLLDKDTFDVNLLDADSMLLENKDGIFSFQRAKPDSNVK